MISICSGLRLMIERPSSTSNTRLQASPKALTYAEAAHSAAAAPTASLTPAAPRSAESDSTGPRTVLSAASGPSSVSVSSSRRVIRPGSATRPTSDDITTSAGKIESTP